MIIILHQVRYSLYSLLLFDNFFFKKNFSEIRITGLTTDTLYNSNTIKVDNYYVFNNFSMLILLYLYISLYFDFIAEGTAFNGHIYFDNFNIMLMLLILVFSFSIFFFLKNINVLNNVITDEYHFSILNICIFILYVHSFIQTYMFK